MSCHQTYAQSVRERSWQDPGGAKFNRMDQLAVLINQRLSAADMELSRLAAIQIAERDAAQRQAEAQRQAQIAAQQEYARQAELQRQAAIQLAAQQEAARQAEALRIQQEQAAAQLAAQPREAQVEILQQPKIAGQRAVLFQGQPQPMPQQDAHVVGPAQQGERQVDDLLLELERRNPNLHI